MATSPTVTPARALLDILGPHHGKPKPTNAMADRAMTDFLADIAALDRSHNRNKRLTQDQLAEQVFRRSPIFEDAKAQTPYLRYQLRVALEDGTMPHEQVSQKETAGFCPAASIVELNLWLTRSARST